MRSSLNRGVFLFVTVAPLLVIGCGDDAPVVWPISSETTTDFPLSSTYGPRTHTSDSVYDFHRGIDIAVPTGTDIHAVAAGKVVQIEQNTSAGGMLVQIEHDGYFSNYIHASSVDVDVGDAVDPGDVIAKSGKATNGFEHLHFEIRKPTDGKKDCAHPLSVLPYADEGAPTLVLGAVDTTNPLAPTVTATATVQGTELDLARVSVFTYEVGGSPSLTGMTLLSEQSYDLEVWNRTWTKDDSDALVDDPNLEGIQVRPEKFNNTMKTWSIAFTFTKLTGPATASALHVRVEAADVKGNVSVVESP